MSIASRDRSGLVVSVALLAILGGCSSSSNDGGGVGATGGVTAQGGTSAVAGSSAGGNPSAGSANQAGTPAAGAGGVTQGGSSAGSAETGGNVTGGTGSAGESGAGTGGTSTAGGGPTGEVPDKIVAGYYPNWPESPIRIKDVPLGYNLIYLFAAKPEGGSPGTTGAVKFDDPLDGRGARTNFKADIQLARTTQKRKIILSVGGAGAGMSFPNRSKSETFVSSIEQIYERLGGFDGMDWNTFEADQAPDTAEMIWISLELKRRHPGFLISAPPAPWNKLDQEFCKTMVEAGAMDYAAPQYYDGPNLATQSYITQSVDTWAELVGASHLVVGFGIWDQPNYMAIGDAVATWKQIKQKHPELRGAFDWQIHLDEGNGWSFVNQMGPVVTQ